MRIDVYTIFPGLIESYCAATIIGRAQREGLVEITALDLRDGTDDERRSVDDTPFGGGAGMILMADPIFRSVEAREAERGPARPLVAMVPHGRPFTQADATRFSELDGFSLLCGRYEGIDQRVLDELVDEELSIGDFVLAGGELAALAVVEASLRLVSGVLGNEASTGEESFEDGLLEYPQWTKPASFRGLEVPEILRSGDHARIARWRHGTALARTIERRPDLIEARGGLRQDESELLEELARLEHRPAKG